MPYDPERHGPKRVVGPGFNERVYAAVSEVPAGSVTTYGDIAAHLGTRAAARQVGYALAALPGDRSEVPWHRVVNRLGRVSERAGGGPNVEQLRRLEGDGCEVSEVGAVADFAARRHRFD